MSLLTYDGVTAPSLVPNNSGSFSSSSNGVTVTALTAMVAPSSCYVGLNDYLVLTIIGDDSTKTISSVVLSNAGAMAFTRQVRTTVGTSFHEVWIAKNTTGTVFPTAGAVVVTFSAAIANASIMVVQVAGAASFNIGTVNSRTTAAINGNQELVNTSGITPALITQQNTLGMGIIAGVATNKWTFTYGFDAYNVIPSSMGQYTLTDTLANIPVRQTAFAGLTSPGLTSYDFVATAPYAYGVSPGGHGDFFGVMLTFTGITIQLDELTFKLTESGVLLNNPSGALPVYDITSVAGLSDMTEIADSTNIDGTDGSYVSAKFVSGKTVVISGQLIDSPPIDETRFDTLKLNCSPVDDAVPLFYKPTNQSPRMLYCKPLSFKSDIDRGKAIGNVPFEVQVASEEGFSRGLIKSTYLDTSVSSTVVITPSGNTETFPDIYFSITKDVARIPGASPVVYIKITAPTWLRTKYSKPAQIANYQGILIQVNTGLTAGLYRLSLSKRTLVRFETDPNIGPVGTATDVSSFITNIGQAAGVPSTIGTTNGRQWFTLIPNVANTLSIIFNNGSGPSTVVGAGFSILYSDAWR